MLVRTPITSPVGAAAAVVCATAEPSTVKDARTRLIFIVGDLVCVTEVLLHEVSEVDDGRNLESYIYAV